MHSVRSIRTHPLVPQQVKVHGLLIHPETGALELVVEDYRDTVLMD
jgi:carbonic anhydrase